MIEVVSIKFKNRGKCYYFSPNGLNVRTGEKVIVETSKGLEIADCTHGNHNVMDTAVVQPLRCVQRIATKDDLRIAQLNVQREKEAFVICQEKIAKHGLDMKLVDVECNFEGTKTMFFFTSDGRVDFRELVKDLASVFRNRIELRQIGVRDEAKMIGGIGICGRPYCCSQFLDDFQPVSTKMAKVQSLSLNPAKISGSCGRLMCCLRYEQEAYEDLIKKVPKQGAFVETKDGFGTAVQVNLLRQTVKVRLDDDSDDSLHLYKANELCAVPGGRPRDGEQPVSTFKYVPEPEPEAEEPEANPWMVEPQYNDPALLEPEAAPAEEPRRGNRRRRSRKPAAEGKTEAPAAQKKEPRPEQKSADKPTEKEGRSAHSRRGGKGTASSGRKPDPTVKQPSGRSRQKGDRPSRGGGRGEAQGQPPPLLPRQTQGQRRREAPAVKKMHRRSDGAFSICAVRGRALLPDHFSQHIGGFHNAEVAGVVCLFPGVAQKEQLSLAQDHREGDALGAGIGAGEAVAAALGEPVDVRETVPELHAVTGDSHHAPHGGVPVREPEAYRVPAPEIPRDAGRR